MNIRMMSRRAVLAAVMALSLVRVAAADDADEVKLATTEVEVKETLLKKGGAAAAGIRVTMDGKTAILTGTVHTHAAYELSTEVALSVPGVKKVDNRLKLVTTEPTRTAAAETEDSWLEAKVKRRLISDIGSQARHLEVEVVDNVVSVRGELDSVERKASRSPASRRPTAVKKFIDLIKVKGEKQ
jgi:osmotically-inducible protein OsmY